MRMKINEMKIPIEVYHEEYEFNEYAYWKVNAIPMEGMYVVKSRISRIVIAFWMDYIRIVFIGWKTIFSFNEFIH